MHVTLSVQLIRSEFRDLAVRVHCGESDLRPLCHGPMERRFPVRRGILGGVEQPCKVLKIRGDNVN